MEKVGRNDPCPCGSGKKYKKCHGKTNVIEFPSKKVEEELDRYLLQFQDYMYDHYPHLFPSTKASSQEEEIEHFVRLLYKGLFVPQTDGETVFQHFFKQKQKSMIRPATTKALKTWGSSHTSIFRLLEEDSDEFVYVEDVLKDGQFKVGRDRIPLDNEDLPHFPYYMGILMNWGNFYNFIPLALPNTKAGCDYFISELQAEFNNQSRAGELSDYLHHNFLRSFPKWLYMEPADSFEESSELSEKQLEVFEVLDEHVDYSDQQLEAYVTLKGLWLRYCEEQDPIIRKPAVFAAALEYFFYEVPYFGGDQIVTQKQVAKKYRISSNSLSRRYKELIEIFYKLIRNYEDHSEDPEMNFYVKPSAQISVERHTYELNKKIEQMSFHSIDEINEYMNYHRNDPFVPANDRELAQVKAYEAYETRNDEEKRRLVDEVLSLDKNSVDGLVLRARFTNDETEKLISVIEAVHSGYNRLDTDEDVSLWQVIEARPLLRAIEFLAELYEEKEEIGKVIEWYEELLELNPQDNQGIRSRLIPLYVGEERYLDVQKLLDSYPENDSLEQTMTIALLMIMLKMDGKDIRSQLQLAHDNNEFIGGLLTGKESMPEELPELFSRGSFEEAVIYVHRNGHLWEPHLEQLNPILKWK
ncbi:SEC-C metal-binding domain-containing protein [Halobacillus hunanensis]|uniref:SEC-C metal-binding domain-containing protein n=1 Tax=Halobacillus hunanensis TaxID=578214 RepID=UPI0009A7B221|nr:SEC-C metal-binding domain-containing protein [Halobacillus hunanensis]